MRRLDYLVSVHVVSLFTDHSNLVFIYDPSGRNTRLARHTTSKFDRWAMKLSEVWYDIEHVDGEKNSWVDMLTRWAVKPNTKVDPGKVGAIKSLMTAPVNPGLDARLDWTRVEEIVRGQISSPYKPPSKFNGTTDGFKCAKDVFWIPKK